jgi:hypothetical protein
MDFELELDQVPVVLERHDQLDGADDGGADPGSPALDGELLRMEEESQPLEARQGQVQARQVVPADGGLHADPGPDERVVGDLDRDDVDFCVAHTVTLPQCGKGRNRIKATGEQRR